MFVRRERGETLDEDRERTRRMIHAVRKSPVGSDSGVAGLRVWSPPPHVSFGRRDASERGFDRARNLAEELGYPTAVRESGGRAVAFTEGTLAFVFATPVEDERGRIQERYGDALDWLQTALAGCDVDAERGEPPHSFCPGSHSLQVGGRKVVGLAQRVRRDVAVLAGIAIVRDEANVVEMLSPVYAALDERFDPDSVGSLHSAAGGFGSADLGDALVSTVRSA